MAIDNLNSLENNKLNYPEIIPPDDPKYYLSAEEWNKLIETLKTLINDYNANIAGLSIGSSLPLITTTDDFTIPTDSNIFSAAKTLLEIQEIITELDGKYLSKVNDDTAEGKITFNKGAEFGNFNTNFTGGNIDQGGNAELNSLKLRQWLEVPELRFNRTEIQMGDKWRSPGGGIIESVDTVNKIITLKLEEGEYGAVAIHDLCMGIFHSMTSSNNASTTVDNGNVRTIQGFATSYFKITELLNPQENNSRFRYELRPTDTNYVNQVDPEVFMNFAVFGNTVNASRQSSAYETRTYQRFLVNVNSWNWNEFNVAAQFGDLSNLTALGLSGITDYSIYLSNVYFTGTIQQMKAPKIENGTWWTWNGKVWVNTEVAATMSGKSAIELYLTNNSIFLYDSDSIDYSPSVTDIHVYEGEEELTYSPGVIDQVGEYDILVTGNNITPGTLSLVEDKYARLSQASDITSNTATITITVTGRRVSGEDFTRSEFQNIALISDGEDGDSVEFIFNQTTTDIPITPDPSELDAVQEPDFVPSEDNGNPTFVGWTDNARGIDSTYKYEWRSQRNKKDGLWGKFSPAKRIARWGENGLDGTEYEYIFKRTEELIAPSPFPSLLDPNLTVGFQEPNFVPEGGYSSLEYTGWTANFVGPSKTLIYSWICKRSKINGVWGAFSNPEVWSTYSREGNTEESIYVNTDNEIIAPEIPDNSVAVQTDNYVPVGWDPSPKSISSEARFQWISTRYKKNEVWTVFNTPPTLHGVYGEDGDSIEFIYNTTSEDVAPSIIYDVPDLNGRIIQDREYLPTDGGTGWGWKDDPVDITRERPYLWVATRRKVNGIWEDFRTPKKLSVHGKDGADIEYVFYLTLSENVPILNQNTLSPSFQEYEYFPKDENNIDWLDERPSVSEIYPYRWISSRKRIDGVWQPFSEPVLDGSYGKIGAAGAMVEYRGVFDPTKTYEGYPSKIVAVKHNDRYYKTKTSAGTFVGAESVPAYPISEDSYWESFGQSLESIATGLLLAENANIANFWFSNQRMESRPTDLIGTNISAPLAMYLDGRSGEAMFSYNNVLFRPDGSGYLANNKISWDELGNVNVFGSFMSSSGANRVEINKSNNVIYGYQNSKVMFSMDFLSDDENLYSSLYTNWGSIKLYGRSTNVSDLVRLRLTPARIDISGLIGEGSVFGLREFSILKANGTSGFKIDLEHSARPGISSNIALISMFNLPTTDLNLVAGEIWRDGNTLKIKT